MRYAELVTAAQSVGCEHTCLVVGTEHDSLQVVDVNHPSNTSVSLTYKNILQLCVAYLYSVCC